MYENITCNARIKALSVFHPRVLPLKTTCTFPMYRRADLQHLPCCQPLWCPPTQSSIRWWHSVLLRSLSSWWQEISIIGPNQLIDITGSSQAAFVFCAEYCTDLFLLLCCLYIVFLLGVRLYPEKSVCSILMGKPRFQILIVKCTKYIGIIISPTSIILIILFLLLISSIFWSSLLLLTSSLQWLHYHLKYQCRHSYKKY